MRDENLRNNVKNMIEEMRRQSIEEIAFYDMKDQFLSEIVEDANIKMRKINENAEELRAENLSPWQKKCCYYLEKNGDCDVSLKAVLVYALAFDFVLTDNRKLQQQTDNRYKYCLIGNNKYEYRGDTMNSYRTTVNEYIKLYAHNNGRVGEFMSHQERNRLWWVPVEKYKIDRYYYWEHCIIDNYEYFDSILPKETRTFIELSDTLGNYIPVLFVKGKSKKTGDAGEEFNGPRGMGPTKDYWDLALLAIYEWYIHKNDEKMKKMLRGTDANVKLCKAWLETFRGENDNVSWDIFVEKNYMQDFVNINDFSDGEVKAGKYGKPKELWVGHFKNSSKMPRNDDFRQFFINASAYIEARGIRIANAIQTKLNEKKNTETLLSELFD